MKRILMFMIFLFSLKGVKAAGGMESVDLQVCFKYDASTGKIMLEATHYGFSTFGGYYQSPFTTWAYVKSGATTYGPFIVTTIVPPGVTTAKTYYEVSIPGFSTQACYQVWFTSNRVWYYADPGNSWGYTPSPSLNPLMLSPTYTSPTGTSFSIPMTDIHEACVCEESDPMLPCNSHFRLNSTVNTRPASTPGPSGLSMVYINGASVELHEFNPMSTYTYEWDGVAGPSSVPTFWPTPFMTPTIHPGTHTVCVTEHHSSGSTCRTCMTFCVPEYTDMVEPGPGMMKEKKDDNTMNENAIDLYPNPTSNQTELRFSLPKDETVSVQIFDIAGKRITHIPAKQMKAGTQKIDLNTQPLSSGMYQVKIQIGNEINTKKLSITK